MRIAGSLAGVLYIRNKHGMDGEMYNVRRKRHALPCVCEAAFSLTEVMSLAAVSMPSAWARITLPLGLSWASPRASGVVVLRAVTGVQA